MTRTITLVAIAALLLGATALAQGGRNAGRASYGAHLQAQAGVGMVPAGQGGMVAARLEGVLTSVPTMGAGAGAAGRGAGVAGPAGAHRGMRGMPTARGAGRFGASTPTPGPRGMGAGQLGRGPSGAMAARVEGAVAAALGLTQDELHALKLDGATIAEIAAERGTPVAAIESTYLAARAEAVQELLAEGSISELQAERMTARGPDAFAELLVRNAAEQGRNAGAAPRFAHRSATTPVPQAARMAPRGGHGGRW